MASGEGLLAALREGPARLSAGEVAAVLAHFGLDAADADADRR